MESVVEQHALPILLMRGGTRSKIYDLIFLKWYHRLGFPERADKVSPSSAVLEMSNFYRKSTVKVPKKYDQNLHKHSL